MSDTMDPLVWTEPTPLPDPNLVDFFTSQLPPSPAEVVQLTPDTPSNSTHPWESDLVTLQEKNALLQEKLADVPRLLQQLERQKAELAAARRRLAAVEAERTVLQDRLDRVERTAKRPRVDNARTTDAGCNCAKKRERNGGLVELFDKIAPEDVADLTPELKSILSGHGDEDCEPMREKLAHAVYNHVLRIKDERCSAMLRRIAEASIVEGSTLPALVEGLLREIKCDLMEDNTNPISLKGAVRVLLLGVRAGAWARRTSAEVLASFMALRREAADLLRIVISKNRQTVLDTLCENTDGRDLNVLWGRSLQAALRFFSNEIETGEDMAMSSRTDEFISRWNDVRTTVEDLQDHASLRDAEIALLLEWSTSTTEECFDGAVRKALLDKVSEIASQTEKMKKMLGLLATLMTVLRSEETEAMQSYVRIVAKWLIALSYRDDAAPRLAVIAVNTALEMLMGHERESGEDREIDAGLVRFFKRNISEQDRKMMSEKVRGFLAQRDLKKGDSARAPGSVQACG